MTTTRDERDQAHAGEERWRQRLVSDVQPESTDSGIPLDILYCPAHVEGMDYSADLGFPGEPPFTRGIYSSMYRGRLWTMRLYSGYATAEDSNARFKFLLSQGETGLSVALDLPTQMGMDSDHPLARDEVGKVGVAIDTLADMEALFADIPLNRVSTSFTINSTAAILLAMYLCVAERQGVPYAEVRGTVQNDILKEYTARKTYIYPVTPSMRLAGDVVTFCSQVAPKFNPISVCGYHMRQAGCDAVQEIAYTMLDALAYVDEVVGRGMPIDEFAPRISFNLSVMRDFFEEVAKLRAFRRLWARTIQTRYAPKLPQSCAMRFFSGGDGTSLTAQEPLNNIVRITLQNLAIILGGAQAVHTIAYDEALGLPTEQSALLALRTQQILGYESGVPRVADPLGGSYYVEWLTNELESRAVALMERIDARGGILTAIERGDIQREIADHAYAMELATQSGDVAVVGVNQFADAEGTPANVEISKPPEAVLEQQLARLERVRAERDAAAVDSSLHALREAARGRTNLMPSIMKAVQAYAAVGEISETLKGVWGTYREPDSL